ncbi:hypothetical protein KIH41_11550 [Litoribacter ruber]|uniref:Ribbon-helix-helix protein, CopG family n=1 Tax=Litoribacter ruber TaxID=702568 RepID=A0AAP2CHR1_9BACT|nr:MULTISPECIES: hypothetical protein [Litoribacter]MBS9524926.1 hypothetical protein [Litoribacter alkaliphilus]MBT0811913.1 hypothetical protein [Litoribacter ruber]
MKTLSLKLDDDVFEDVEYITKRKKIARNRYINEALEFYNAYQKRQILAKRIAYEADLVKEESMNVLRDFDSLIDED